MAGSRARSSAPARNPVFLFPRMFAAFDLREQPAGEVIVVNETDDGAAIFERVAKGIDGDGHRRGRRPRLDRDGAPPRTRGRLRAAADRIEDRQRAAADEERRRARGDGSCRRDGGTDDGGRRAARRAWRDDGRARRSGGARAARRRLALPVVRDAHLHGDRRGRLRLAHADRPYADPGRHLRDVRLRRRRRRLLLRLRPHRLLRRAAAGLPRRVRRDARRLRGRQGRRQDRRARPGRERGLPGSRSRLPGSASTSATGWVTASAWTSTSGRSSRPRTRRRSRPG